MLETSLNILAVVGSLHRESVTRIVVVHVAQRLQAAGCEVDVLDFEKEPLALYNPDTAHDLPQRMMPTAAALVVQRCSVLLRTGLYPPESSPR